MPADGSNMVPFPVLFQGARGRPDGPATDRSDPMDPTEPAPAALTSAQPAPATGQPTWPRAPRSLAASRGAAWWGEGWRIFLAAPALWIGLMLVLMIAMVAMGMVVLIGNLAQALLWPVFTGGLLLGCHALAQGRPLQFQHLFAGFSDRLGALLILGLVALAVSAIVTGVMITMALGAIGFTGAIALISGDPVSTLQAAIAGASLAALITILIALGAYALFLMAWWFATPLVLLNRAEPLDALKASFDASWKNLGALTISGLIFLGLAILASIPFGLGWLVLAPVAVGAGYASWREVFGD